MRVYITYSDPPLSISFSLSHSLFDVHSSRRIINSGLKRVPVMSHLSPNVILHMVYVQIQHTICITLLTLVALA